MINTVSRFNTLSPQTSFASQLLSQPIGQPAVSFMPVTSLANTSNYGFSLPDSNTATAFYGSLYMIQQIMQGLLSIFLLLRQQSKLTNNLPSVTEPGKPATTGTAGTPGKPATAMPATDTPNPNADETYKGIGIMTSTMTPDEVKKLKKNLDTISADPDGQKLLAELKKNNTVMQKSKLSEGTYAQGGTDKVEFSQSFFDDWDKKDDKGLEVMVHEITHSAIRGTAAYQEKGWSQDDEAMASVMGRRIRFRADRQIHDVTLGGKTFNYNGTTQAEQQDYELGFASFAGNMDYGRNTSVFAALNELGITFGFGPKPANEGNQK
jgi:hypothetical protein